MNLDTLLDLFLTPYIVYFACVAVEFATIGGSNVVCHILYDKETLSKAVSSSTFNFEYSGVATKITLALCSLVSIVLYFIFSYNLISVLVLYLPSLHYLLVISRISYIDGECLYFSKLIPFSKDLERLFLPSITNITIVDIFDLCMSSSLLVFTADDGRKKYFYGVVNDFDFVVKYQKKYNIKVYNHPYLSKVIGDKDV